MIHSFDIDVATKYGIEEAIMLNHLYYWTERNKANEINYYDGFYWSYNSSNALSILFPYMSQKKIQRLLLQLEKLGLIVSGNYNKLSFDRTKWYALTEEGYAVVSGMDKNCNMDSSEMSNEIRQGCPMSLDNTVQPIPSIIPDNNTYIYKGDEIEKPDMCEWYDKFLAIYPKKNNYVSGQKEFFNFFKDIPIEEWKPRAKEMFDALLLYLKDYKTKKPDDKDFTFVPALDKWFREDAMYWIKEVSNEQTE